jgi:hypothetical protein
VFSEGRWGGWARPSPPGVDVIKFRTWAK